MATNTPQHDKLNRMSWDEMERALAPAATRGGARPARAGADAQALREYFGDEEFEYLRKLASHAAAMRTRAEPRGNVVLVPGIMGSALSSTQGGDTALVWVNFARLALGRIERLRLSDDGSRDHDSTLTVAASDLVQLAYARTVLWLRARWNVEPYPFDWRKDIDAASKGLKELIEDKFGGSPVHIVAHSMGGLVSRNFIRLFPKVWERMRDAEGARGGRLVMLGTPNYGSYAIPQVLTGTETLVKWLARADIRHSRAEIIDILSTFVGSYQMLPAPSRVPAATQAIYRASTWGDFPVKETHLQRAMQFHDELERGNAVDPSRMFYVAGCGRETISGMSILSPGEFDYTTTFDGDGRVTHELGLLKDVPAYFADTSHGDLATDEKVLAAVDEMLELGATAALPRQPPVTRSARAEGSRWMRGPGEQGVGSELETVARRVEEERARPEEVRKAERTLHLALLGRDIEPDEIPQVAEEEDAARKRRRRVRLEVRAVRGDITRVAAPLVVVGHYQGIPPNGADGAIDHAIDYWISRASEHGMIGAGLGQLFFIPVHGDRMKARSVLLAGMGESGKFRRDSDARLLLMNVTLAVGTLGVDRFATVVIGSGAGNMSKETALRGMIQGVCEALHRLPRRRAAPLVRQLILVEYDERQYEEVVRVLEGFVERPPVEELELKLTRQILPKGRGQRRVERPADLPEAADDTRIHIERSGDSFRFSAMTSNAVIPVRDETVNPKYLGDAAERLMTSLKQRDQEKYGQLLYSYLFPVDFHQVIDAGKPLTIVLDRATAGLPWEMACYAGPQGMTFLGPDLRLTRQFRTRLSSAPGVTPPPKRRLKALVIADPAREQDLQLPGALREGRAVVEILNEFKRDGRLEIEIVKRIGAAECDAVEILALLLNENFDLIHYAGHGVFDEQSPSESGWVFGRNDDGKLQTLSAREIFKARRVPRLVLANACFSAVVREGRAATADEMNRDLAGMAEAFFERGVQNYIGAGWPVGDAQAVNFTTAFYRRALAGAMLGDAVSDGRKAILGQGSTWGAYHHYGRSNAVLVRTDAE